VNTIKWQISTTHPDIGFGFVNGRKVVTMTQFELDGRQFVKATSYLEALNDLVRPQSEIEDFKAHIQDLVSQYETLEPNELAARSGYLRVEDLDRVKGLLKIKKLAELAGLSASAIAQKVGRGTQLTVTESEAMTKVLADVGMPLQHRKPTTNIKGV